MTTPAPEKSATPTEKTLLLPWRIDATGVLLQRYKRFLMDVRLDSGEVITAHTANTGSMRGLTDAGAAVWLSKSNNKARKLPYSVQAVADVGNGGTMVGCNTSLPNHIASVLLKGGHLPVDQKYTVHEPEVVFGPEDRSRVDWRLRDATGSLPPLFLEVKSVTLREGKTALFPDAVSTRGQKHLDDLEAEVQKGNKAMMLYVVQRDDCQDFAPAAAIDAKYTALLRRVLANGVQAVVVVASVEKRGLSLGGFLPLREF